MWNNLTPQQQQYLMAMLMGHQGGMPAQGMPTGMPQQPAVSPQFGVTQQPAMPLGAQLGNPLMTGGPGAVNPQQQAAMMQYMQMLQNPQGGAGANGQLPPWALMLGRSPMYGTGGTMA